MQIEEPSAVRQTRGGIALLELGFRPFYLCAALFGSAAVLAWLGMLEGSVPVPALVPPQYWHAHEMVFGFALAVISGFVLTAGRVWTGLPTPTGPALAALVLLWVSGRIFMLTGPGPLTAVIDTSYAFVLAAVLGRVLIAAASARNYFVIVLLCGMGTVNGLFHLSVLEEVSVPTETMLKAALYLVIALVMVIAGRVVPAFTAGGIRGIRVIVRPVLDRTAIGAAILAFSADIAWGPTQITGSLFFIAAVLHVARQAGWSPFATVRVPLVWILQVSYAWIPVAFTLFGFAGLGLVGPAAGLHALGAGAMGGMIMAMMTRTALGHTARPLNAGRAEVAAYVLVHAAAALRVVAGVLPDFGYAGLVRGAGLLWAASFLLYFSVYLPRLLRPRLDGKPG